MKNQRTDISGAMVQLPAYKWLRRTSTLKLQQPNLSLDRKLAERLIYGAHSFGLLNINLLLTVFYFIYGSVSDAVWSSEETKSFLRRR
jgi:hypothetical protein